jgi:hypothetical protein
MRSHKTCQEENEINAGDERIGKESGESPPARLIRLQKQLEYRIPLGSFGSL